MKNAQCKKCLNKFYEKEIYTIQQFQYRKEPTYKWLLAFFKKLEINEWDSFCEKCITLHANESKRTWENQKSKLFIVSKKIKNNESRSRKSKRISKRI